MGKYVYNEYDENPVFRTYKQRKKRKLKKKKKRKLKNKVKEEKSNVCNL